MKDNKIKIPQALSLQNQELPYWLALWHIPEIGIATIQTLRKFFPAWQELFNAKSTTLAKCGLKPNLINQIKNPPWSLVEKDLLWLTKNPKEHHILTLEDSDYAKLLREIAYPPALLFVRGNSKILNAPQLAMVGSRNPSHLGKETAFAFAAELASAGLTITSGLALGIDAACHRGALSVAGKTIAIMGTGIDHIYPAQHVDLAEEIVAHDGALVTEFLLGALPKAGNFPKRNRIISGLSLGALVLEAAKASGSLITARFALEQNREVFALPGSIHNPLARGCHVLLRQGAKLVETACDVLEELKPYLSTLKSMEKNQFLKKETQKQKNPLDSSYRKLLECIDYAPTSIDCIAGRSNFSVSEVTTKLMELELKGLIKASSGGYVRVH